MKHITFSPAGGVGEMQYGISGDRSRLGANSGSVSDSVAGSATVFPMNCLMSGVRFVAYDEWKTKAHV